MAVVSLAEAREARRPQESPKNGGKGFALLHRKIMDTPFYKDPEASHLWVHLLLRANYEPTVVQTENGDVLCQRGQFISGRNSLAYETGIESNRVQYLLRKYQKLGMLSTQSNKKFTVFTVIKYDEYQQFSVPTDYQQITNAKPVIPTPTYEVVPTDYQQITTEKELNNNSLDKSNECATGEENSEPEQQKPNKQKISCDEVWQCLKDEIPEARGWKSLTDGRRNMIRNFWTKANKIARNLDGKPLDLEGFRLYLRYIRENCRWMLEDRPDERTGKTWRKLKFDSFLTEKLYIEVREGDKDDR
ncbi:DNA replication protein [Pectobacterium zantedeschiae]|uniref:DNA replication protein n=1 Tax=Pectobacterium zantedeschiae TaxID=2034769 RepID=UPI0032EFA186